MSHAFQPSNDLPSYCRCGKHREALEHRTGLEDIRHAEAEERANRSSGQLRRENAALYVRVRELEKELADMRSEVAAASRLLVAAQEIDGHPGAYAVLMIERDGYKDALERIARNAGQLTADWCRRTALFGLGKGEPTTHE